MNLPALSVMQAHPPQLWTKFSKCRIQPVEARRHCGSAVEVGFVAVHIIIVASDFGNLKRSLANMAQLLHRMVDRRRPS